MCKKCVFFLTFALFGLFKFDLRTVIFFLFEFEK